MAAVTAMMRHALAYRGLRALGGAPPEFAIFPWGSPALFQLSRPETVSRFLGGEEKLQSG